MLCLGVIVALHGLKGYVRVRSYFQSKLNFEEIDLFIDGKHYKVDGFFYKKLDTIVLKLSEINDCDSAQKFIKKEIYVDRSILPVCQEDEYYHADLIGMDVEINERKIGVVLDLKNFGASDILEVRLDDYGKLVMVPFTSEFCTQVDLNQRKIEITENALT